MKLALQVYTGQQQLLLNINRVFSSGYIVLMTQVARGKPQAGLPLLNGGSILGYLITTIIVLGIDALAFNITLF